MAGPMSQGLSRGSGPAIHVFAGRMTTERTTRMAPPNVIRLHPHDSVVIARTTLLPGTPVADGVAASERIPAGHKIAVRPIAAGEPVAGIVLGIVVFGDRIQISPGMLAIEAGGKNGIIAVRLAEAEVQELLARSTKNPQHKITINLERQTVTDDQGFKAHFDIDPFRKYCLLNGLDDIGLTLRHEGELNTFESTHDEEFWSAPKGHAA